MTSVEISSDDFLVTMLLLLFFLDDVLVDGDDDFTDFRWTLRLVIPDVDTDDLLVGEDFFLSFSCCWLLLLFFFSAGMMVIMIKMLFKRQMISTRHFGMSQEYCDRHKNLSGCDE